MAKVKTFNQIPHTCRERFLPMEQIAMGYLGKAGVVNGGLSELTPGAVIGRSSDRPYHIMIYTLEGTGRFVMDDGVEMVVGPSTFFFSNAAGAGHRHLPISGLWRLAWIQIDKSATLFPDIPRDYIFKVSRCHREVEAAMNAVIQEGLNPGPGSEAISNLQSQLLVRYLMREMSVKEVGKTLAMRMSRFSELWNEVALKVDQPWDIGQMCSFMNLGRAHLNRLCREAYGLSPAEKVRQIKLDTALSLLNNLGYTVSQTAELVGYSTVSSFSAAFKKHFGFTPKEAEESNYSVAAKPVP